MALSTCACCLLSAKHHPVGAVWRRGKKQPVQEPGRGRTLEPGGKCGGPGSRSGSRDLCSPVTRAEVDGGRGQEVGAWAVLEQLQGWGYPGKV